MSRYGPKIAALARRADREREQLEPDLADSDEATRYLREGAGPAIWLYVEGRTGGRSVRFAPAELSALEAAMNTWIECYTLCHGVDVDADVSIRTAAELLLETRNVHDVGQLVTGVPSRRD